MLPVQNLCNEFTMTSKNTHIARYRKTLSPTMMWMGMLFACFAWLIHVSPFVATLWNDNIGDENAHHVHLNYNLPAELTPLISAVEQYERIKTDIAQTNRTSPYDSAAHQLYSHYTSTSETISATEVSIDTGTIDANVAPATSPNLQHHVSIQSSESNNGHHSRCSLCATISVALLPTLIKLNAPYLIEPVIIMTALNFDEASSYAANFLRPLSRAPPSVLQT